MKNAVFLGSLFVVLTCFSGCGNSPDSLMKQQISQMNEMADALEKGASESEVEAIQKRMDATGKKLEDLNLSDEEGQKLLERHKEELTKAIQRLLTASMGKAVKEMGKGFPGMPAGGGVPGMPAGGGFPGMPGGGEL